MLTSLIGSPYSLTCAQMWVFPSFSASTSRTQMFCASAWSIPEVFYTMDSEALASMQIDTARTSSIPMSEPETPLASESRDTQIPTPGSSASSSMPASTSPPEPSPPTSSQAWIAGPVLGAVLGMVIIAGLAFWLGRRRERKHGPATATIAVSSVPTGTYPSSPFSPGIYHSSQPAPKQDAAIPPQHLSYHHHNSSRASELGAPAEGLVTPVVSLMTVEGNTPFVKNQPAPQGSSGDGMVPQELEHRPWTPRELHA